MTQNQISVDDTVEFARYLADQARLISAPGFRKPIEINKKNDASPVTEIDRTVEKFVREMVKKTYPSLGF